MKPIIFEPYVRPQVWGERRLERLLGKVLPPAGRFGESWEISAHPHHVSRVAEGEHRGMLLTDLWRQFGDELLGRPAPHEFPLLIKYLDCHELLSVQVHPTDALARELLGDELGKTEAWVVLTAEPAARIYAGLKHGTTERDLQEHLERGNVADCLHSFVPQPGDCLFIPAGTVHAVGGGVLMAEVQQSSDATFRLFDWNRPGPDGKPRQLHLEQSLQSINWQVGPVEPIRVEPRNPVEPQPSATTLVSCAYFELTLHRIQGPFRPPRLAELSIWMTLAGESSLRCSSGFLRQFRCGETVLLPAHSEATWEPPNPNSLVQLLEIRIPDDRTTVVREEITEPGLLNRPGISTHHRGTSTRDS